MPEHAESNASADVLVDVEEPLLGSSDDFAEKEGHCQHRSAPGLCSCSLQPAGVLQGRTMGVQLTQQRYV